MAITTTPITVTTLISNEPESVVIQWRRGPASINNTVTITIIDYTSGSPVEKTIQKRIKS